MLPQTSPGDRRSRHKRHRTSAGGSQQTGQEPEDDEDDDPTLHMHGSDLNRRTADVQFDGTRNDLHLQEVAVALSVLRLHFCKHSNGCLPLLCKADLPSLLLQRGIICNSWHNTRRMCDCPTRACCRPLMLISSTACVLVMPLMCTDPSVI